MKNLQVTFTAPLKVELLEVDTLLDRALAAALAGRLSRSSRQ